VGRNKRRDHLGLLVVLISLAMLLFVGADQTAGSDSSSEGSVRIRVEEGRDFTRVVFPCDHPDDSTVEPDLDERRFIFRLSDLEAEISPPRLDKSHPLVEKIEVLTDPQKGLEVQVILRNPSVDWVSYRYEHPPRMVLYLRERTGPDTPSPEITVAPVPQEPEVKEAKKPQSPPKPEQETTQETEKPVDLSVPAEPVVVDRGVEGPWHPPGRDIPEFIRVKDVYPPDFHEMGRKDKGSYQRALEMFRKRDFRGAKEMASTIVPRDRLSAVAETLVFFNADCDFHMAEDEGGKAYFRAIQTYQEAVARFPQSKHVPKAILTMAAGYRRLEFFQEAVAQYQIFLSKFPTSPAASEALFWQGECLFQTEKYERAKGMFEEFVREFPHVIHGRIAALRVGDCLYHMGDLEAARKQYGAVLSESSDLSLYPLDSLHHAALTLLENREFQKGRELLFRAVNLDPGSKTAREMMDAITQSYLDENREDEALRANLLLCESFGGPDSLGLERVSLADMRLSRPELQWPPLSLEACLDPIGVYQEFLDHCQDVDLADEVMYRQSLGLVRRGDIERAVGNLETILSRRQPGSLRQQSGALLAYCLNTLIQQHHGRSECVDVIQMYKDNADFLRSEENTDKGTLLLVADSFQNSGLLEDALAVYRLVEAHKNVAQDHVLFRIGQILALRGDKENAKETLETCCKAFPRSPYIAQVQRLLGDLSFEMMDYPTAVKWYRLTLASVPKSPEAGRVYMRLGQALKRSGRPKEAVDALETAIAGMELFKEQSWAKKLLGESLAELASCYDETGRLSEAAGYYQRIVRLSPSEDQVNWALYRLGESHRKMGNMEMMGQAFEDLDKRSTDSLWTRLAEWAREDAVFEAEAGEYLGGVRGVSVERER